MRAGVPSLLLALGAAMSLVYLVLNPPSKAFIAGGQIAGTQIVGEGFPKRLIDPLGREHRLVAPPRRSWPATRCSPGWCRPHGSSG